MTTRLTSRMREIVRWLKEGAVIWENRDAFLEVSTYEIIHEQTNTCYGNITEPMLDKLAERGLIRRAGRYIKRDKAGNFITAETCYEFADPNTPAPTEEEGAHGQG
jgi:hypothetical protein